MLGCKYGKAFGYSHWYRRSLLCGFSVGCSWFPRSSDFQLAAHGFHAAVTYGNAPSIDILVGLLDGSATLSLQVKTSHWALPTRGRGEKKTPHHYEWDVGQKSAMLQRPDLFFAFVDLKLGSGQLPDVFIIPSEFVYKSFQYAITKYLVACQRADISPSFPSQGRPGKFIIICL